MSTHFPEVTRRGFIQIASAGIASLILPGSPQARGDDVKFWFLHADTGDFWPVADPILWALENEERPILARARQRLLTLWPADGDVATRSRPELL